MKESSDSDSKSTGRYPPVDMTYEDYEREVVRLFTKAGRGVSNVRVKHRDLVKGHDGDYVIDTTVRFEALGGAEFLVLIEAKFHKRPVERSVVQELR